MSTARSSGSLAIAAAPAPRADGALLRSIIRWAVLGAAGAIALIIALSQGMSAGAAAPVAYDANCIAINFNVCVPVGGFTTTPTTATTTVATTNTTTGLPPNTVVSTYVDPRYCGGLVSVETDSTGHLIDVCTFNGQRFIPVFPDFGFNFAPGFLGANFVNAPAFLGSSFIPPGTFNGITCNGVFGCPLGGGVPFNGNFVNGNFINGNFVNGAFFNGFNGNVFPAGGTVVGGAVFYNDNRFCTDGKLVFVPNRGYFCQNGGPLVPNGVTTVNCGNFFFDGCGIFRPFEAAAAATAAAQPVTTFAAPAAKAPVAPAAVAAPAAPVAPAAVVAPAAPVTAKVAAPMGVAAPAAAVAPAAPVTAKAAPVAAPAATTVDTDDHRG